jgi:hypothetical protein
MSRSTRWRRLPGAARRSRSHGSRPGRSLVRQSVRALAPDAGQAGQSSIECRRDGDGRCREAFKPRELRRACQGFQSHFHGRGCIAIFEPHDRRKRHRTICTRKGSAFAGLVCRESLVRRRADTDVTPAVLAVEQVHRPGSSGHWDVRSRVGRGPDSSVRHAGSSRCRHRAPGRSSPGPPARVRRTAPAGSSPAGASCAAPPP